MIFVKWKILFKLKLYIFNYFKATETPFVSRALGVEHKNQTSSPPLPPINQIARSKSFVSMSKFLQIFLFAIFIKK